MPFRDSEGQDILRGDETLIDREDPTRDTSGDSGQSSGSPIGGQTNTTQTQTTTTTTTTTSEPTEDPVIQTTISTQLTIPFNVSIEVEEHVTIPIKSLLEQVVNNRFDQKFDSYYDDLRVGKTLLNLRDDRQIPVLNWKEAGTADFPEIALKLAEPLDTTQYPLNTSAFVSRETLNSVYENIRFLTIEELLVPRLRPAKDVAVGKSSRVTATLEELIPNIAGGTGVADNIDSDYRNFVTNGILENLYNENSGMDVNINYSSFDKFVTFGSAQKRIDVFKAKLQQIEQYITDAPVFIENLNISASSADQGTYETIFGTLVVDSSGNSSLTGSSNVYNMLTSSATPPTDFVNSSINTSIKIQELMRSFDGYEKELWFRTGLEYTASNGEYYNATQYQTDDYTYPKILGIPLATTHTSASTWYTSMSVIATDYDSDNPNILSQNVPTYIQEDEFSGDFVTFTEMIGHHFDNVKTYITNLENISSRYPKVDEEISGDMAKKVLESFGISAPSIASVEKLINYVTGNNTNDPYKDIANEYYKRYLHALPFLLRTKGTKQSVHSLLNVFGINPDLITIKENISGRYTSLEPKKVTTTEQDFSLNLNQYAYIKVPFSSSLRNPQTIQARFNLYDDRTQPLFRFKQLGSDDDYTIRAALHPSATTNTYYENTGRIELLIDNSPIVSNQFTQPGDTTETTFTRPGFAQEFMTPVGLVDDITGVSLGLQRTGNDSRNIRVAIYPDNLSSPFGPDTDVAELGGDTFSITNIPVTSADSVDFEFSTPVTLTANTRYWIVLYDSGSDSSNYLTISGQSGNPYGSGDSSRNSTNPPTASADWSNSATVDYWFEVYTSDTLGPQILVSSSYFDLFDNEFTSIQLKYDSAGAILDIRKVENEDTTFTQSLQETQMSMSADWTTLDDLYLGIPSISSSTNNDYTSASLDEFRMWGDTITEAKFIEFAENPGMYAGNTYTSSLEDLYVRLSFNLPTDVNTDGYIPNTSPYVSKSEALDLTNISGSGFPVGTSPLYNTSRIIRSVTQNSYFASDTTDMIRIAPEPPTTMSLSSTDTTVGVYEKFLSSSVATNELDISISPVDAIDREIIRAFGNINLGEYLGDPQDTNRDSYSGLDDLENVFIRELAPTINHNGFVRYFDKFLNNFYESIEQFLPARSKLRKGIVIRPNILNRTKVNNRENIKFSGETSRRSQNFEHDAIYSFDVNVNTLQGNPDEVVSTEVYGLFNTNDVNYSINNFGAILDSTNLQSMTGSYDSYEGTTRLTNHEEFVYGDMIGNTSSFGALEAILPRTYKENITGNVQTNLVGIGAHCDLWSLPPDSRFAYVREASTYFNSPYGLYYVDKRRDVPITSSYMLENGGPNDQGTWTSGQSYRRGDVVLQPVGLTASSGEVLSKNGRLFAFVGSGYPANSLVRSTNPPEQDRNWQLVTRRSEIYQDLVRVINTTGSAYISGSSDQIKTTVVDDLTLDWEGNIPLEYTHRHFRFCRDKTLGGLRRTYLGTLNTKATSADGGFPYEIFDIEGNTLTVGSPEPCADCD